MSYFDAMREGLYRRSIDGRRVFARRSLLPWRKRWYYVEEKDRESFERRIFRMHIAWMGVVIVVIPFLANRLLSDPLLLAAWFLLIALLPALQSWTTSDLEPASIDEKSLEPQDRRGRDLAIARALGRGTLWFLAAAGVAMAVGQLYVIVTDGDWWAWLGLALFTASTISILRQLFLLREVSALPARPESH